MAGVNLKSLEECLNKYIPKDELIEVKRILYGRSDEYVTLNENQLIEICCDVIRFFSHELHLSENTKEIGNQHNFEVRGYAFQAQPEEWRKPRIVRVSLLMHLSISV